MEDLSLHIMDLVENSLRCAATTITVRLVEDPAGDRLTIELTDNGRGMDAGTLRMATDPFFSTKPGKRTGLGLSLLRQCAEEAGGGLSVKSAPGCGTKVVATFRYSHPDRKPIGDVDSTVRLLRAYHPEIALIYEHERIEDRE